MSAEAQPHPAIFLAGARRELRTLLDSAAIQEPAAVATIQRVERLLADLAVRWSKPSMARTEMRVQAEQLRALARGEDGEVKFGAARDEFARASQLESTAIAQHQAEVDALLNAGQSMSADADADEALRRIPSADALTQYLRRRLPSARDLIVTDVRQLRGVNSKDIIFLDIEGYPQWPRSVVMRRLRALSLNLKASMPYEFDLLAKLHTVGLPVPRPLLVDDSGAEFGHPFLITERVAGEARTVDELGDRAHGVIAQLAELLARIHRLDALALGLGRNERSDASARERLLPFLEEYYQKWTRHQVDPSPTLERTFAWLRANVGRIDETRVLVHGDYDLRNVLIGDSGITAVLDWERSHVGHPAEDLAYCMQDVLRVMPRDEFLQRYRQAGGPAVAIEAIEYFQLWAAMARLTGSAEVKDTYLRGRHRDFVLGTAGVFQYPRFMRQVADLLAALDPCN